MSARRRAILPRLFLAFSLAGVVAWGLQATAITRQGVNFAVSNHSIPLHVKILDFLHRDAHYRLLAQQITGGLTSDQERVLAVFDWTRRNIQPTPQGWPVVDDHILNIIIRGYGLDDQMADVFTTLSTYAGVPAFWRWVRTPETPTVLVLSFAKVEGAWRVFDAAHGVVFTDPQGRLLDVEVLLADPALAAPTTTGAPARIPYAEYFTRLRPFTVPATLRAEQQMPWPRFVYEVQHALHLSREGRGARHHVDQHARLDPR